jgi:alpha-1,2-mannosyltransferase
VKAQGEIGAASTDHFGARIGVKGAASAFIGWLRDGAFVNRARLDGYPKMIAVIYLALAVTSIILGRNPAVSHHVIAFDYAKCVAASSLALHGHAAAAYDDRAEQAAEREVTGDPEAAFLIWDYPPPFLLFVLPAAMLPYKSSLLAWTLITFAGYLLVMGAITRNHRAWWPIIAFPGALVTMLDGQNGFITLALMAGGLLLLERRPIAAGVLLGLLCYKPQFGILLPVLLIAGGYQKTFLSAATTVVALIFITIALFGVETWRGFFAGLPETNQWLFVNGVGFFKMQSVFGAARMWHASMTTAIGLHAIAAVASGAATWWIWRKPVASELKCAALMVGTLLITPYVLDYDLVLLAAPIAWLALEGLKSRFLPWEKLIMVLAWLLPMWSRWIGMVYAIPLGPVVLSLTMLAIIRRVMTITMASARVAEGSKQLEMPHSA